MTKEYVNYPARECVGKQCQYTACATLLTKAEMHEQAAKVAVEQAKREIRRVGAVSAALWCDPGEHPFSSKDEYDTYTRRRNGKTTDRYTSDDSEEITVCYRHMLNESPPARELSGVQDAVPVSGETQFN